MTSLPPCASATIVTSRRLSESVDVAMADLPQGTVTFLFTDIEGSTALWEWDRTAMRQAVNQHLEFDSFPKSSGTRGAVFIARHHAIASGSAKTLTTDHLIAPSVLRTWQPFRARPRTLADEYARMRMHRVPHEWMYGLAGDSLPRTVGLRRDSLPLERSC